jgi:Phage integrase family
LVKSGSNSPSRRPASPRRWTSTEASVLTSSPAIRLGKWTDTKKRNQYRRKQKRTLNLREIKTFWHGLDREDSPHTRHTRLALKFELATMLRGCEFIPLRKDEVHGLDTSTPYIHIPLERVKKRDHDLLQPLSPLAVEIIREALKDNDTDYVFPAICYRFGSRRGRHVNKPLARTATSTALRDRRDSDVPGLCTLLGLKKFAGHDVRRTAASLVRSLGVPLSKVSMCLDHAIKREDGIEIPSVTRDHYVVGHFAEDAEMAEKREVLDKLSEELRRIVAPSPASTSGRDEAELAMAA